MNGRLHEGMRVHDVDGDEVGWVQSVRVRGASEEDAARSLMQVLAYALGGAPPNDVNRAGADAVAVRIVGDGRLGERWADGLDIGDANGEALRLAVPWDTLSPDV